MDDETRRDYDERILRVLVYIQQHLDENPSLDELAEVACFSPWHFHRIFGATVGESVGAHVRRLRLERAAQHLVNTDAPVVRVALDAGYEAHESFTRAFGSMFGLSPSEFRRRGGLEHPESPSGVHYAPDGERVAYRSSWKGDRTMEVRIVEREPCRVAFVRNTGPYGEAGFAWQRLMAWAGPKRLLGPQMQAFGICHDDPKLTPADKVRYDACLVVGDGVEAEGDVGIQEVVGGPYAVATHEGAYDDFSTSYGYLYAEWLPANGYQCRNAPALEIYYNNPQNTPPEELRTDICVPVERA